MTFMTVLWFHIVYTAIHQCRLFSCGIRHVLFTAIHDHFMKTCKWAHTCWWITWRVESTSTSRVPNYFMFLTCWWKSTIIIIMHLNFQNLLSLFQNYESDAIFVSTIINIVLKPLQSEIECNSQFTKHQYISVFRFRLVENAKVLLNTVAAWK